MDEPEPKPEATTGTDEPMEEHYERRHGERRKSVEEELEPTNKLTLIFAVLGSFFKSGPWAVLSLLLVWFLLVQRDSKQENIQNTVAANGAAIQAIGTKMDLAAQSMSQYVVNQEEEQNRSMLLLLEVCVQQAQATRVPGTTERCFAAARGNK